MGLARVALLVGWTLAAGAMGYCAAQSLSAPHSHELRKRGRDMATGREEAAPTFSTWKGRLEGVDISHRHEEVARFVEVLRAVGTPMIDDLEVNFVYCDPHANRVQLAGEFNQWGRRGGPI